ncbi:MAG TPA: N-acetyl-gamma-glutamyl-phosphate reductase [Ferruginibacter sp.]|nr:N-acetyl-gamma-glutamyl-phosphate reductase [Ferruginibacter sp.]
MANKIKVGIVGGAGYTGGELIRILLNHSLTEIVFVHSKSNADKFLYEVHKDLYGDTTMKFASALNQKIDILFLCVGHGEAIKFLATNTIAAKIKIIDLSQDFRLGETSGKRKFVYGLPELNRAQIKKANNIANPGCFATTIQLGLLPLAKEGLLKEINITGITGSTGAGQSLSDTAHFSWRANNVQAYKTLSHQHLAEIGQSFIKLNPSANIELNFVPWRGDFTRGIFISSQIKCSLSLDEVLALYKKFYATHPFIVVSKESVFLKQVVNTNKCFIQPEKVGSKLVVHSIADNLLKGASGQAVQNMNLMFGLEETTGLKLKANYF